MARNWFHSRQGCENFTKHAIPRFSGKPISYLEIGNYQGISLAWVSEHVLNHPESRGVGVDPYLPMHNHSAERIEQIREECLERIKPFSNVQQVRSKSIDFLMNRIMVFDPRSYGAPYDFIYIDGVHFPGGVMADAVLSWQYLKVGGLLAFDDYGLRPRRQRENHIARTIDNFLLTYEHHIEILVKNYQVLLIKTSEATSELK